MNGYKNEETFDMGLIVDNDRGLLELFQSRKEESTIWELADFMKETMQELIDDILESLPTSAAGLAIRQMADTAMSKVDWKELAETI